MARTTLEDVAKKAGVSFKTVSRVLNNEPNVAAATAAKVKRAIAELNYVPNSAARSLSSGRAMAIGLVVGWPVNSPYASALIDCTLRESSRSGYNLALFSIGDNVTKKIVDAFRGRKMDGIILDTNAAEDETLVDQLKALNVPYIVIHPNRKSHHIRASFIQIDNVASSRTAVEYLLELGHRAIGIITYSSGLNQEDERLLGYRKAFENAGLAFHPEWVFKSDGMPFQVGSNGAHHLLENNRELSAIFAATDEIAMGTLVAIWQMGLKIPDDISVVGFDDIFYASMIAPPLTTIHQPIDEIACLAVQHLIRLIDCSESEPVDLLLPTRLVIRDSCKPQETGVEHSFG